ncbi:MAG: carboxylating nicotinate-nucleotide diphosphorylase [Acidimicrobiia bacterium]
MNPLELRRVVETALGEDLGLAGDLTTAAVVAADATTVGRVVAREPGRVAGTDVLGAVFGLLDPRVEVMVDVADGEDVVAGQVVARVVGPTRPILTGERVALNLLGRMCGIATATAQVVAAVAGTDTVIADTRKTTPGLRALEKHAVRMGGGRNHRFGLDAAVMVKDNHVVAAGGIRQAVEAVRERVGHTVTIEVEVDTLAQLEELLEVGADIVLLDNMDPATLAEAVAMVDGRMVTEASGGVTSDTVRTVADAGVDVISLGWLTHSAPALDVALDLG